MPLQAFQKTSFTHDGATRDLYKLGTGPGVVIMHEIPGITPEVARFGHRVAEAGFSAVLPHLFGTPGKPMTAAYAAGELVRACVSREFYVLARGASSPIADWLRALCRQTLKECGGPGVGAIGMCLTGNFALSLMLDESVLAPVLSQPSLPLPITPSRRGEVHLAPAELAEVKQRAQAGCKVLGLRFTEDPMVPKARFDTLRRELGDSFEAIEIDSSRGNPFGIPSTAHSVVTKDLVDEEGHPTREALDRVLGFFAERLRAT